MDRINKDNIGMCDRAEFWAIIKFSDPEMAFAKLPLELDFFNKKSLKLQQWEKNSKTGV